MLFGRKRVSNRVHTLATWMVAIGTSLSAFWILALNSWMQTPAGFEMRDGQAFVLNWMDVIFNPSMPYRIVHMMLASGLTAAFVVAGLSAFRQLRGDTTKANRVALRVAIWLAAILIPLQIFAGDLHGLNTVEHQPAKVAAMEGLWEDTEGADLLLYLALLAAYVSVVFYLASQAAVGRIPRERERLDNPMQQSAGV